MSMWQLAFQNFKASFKNYLSLIISLAFTIIVFFNFQNIINSGILDQLGKANTQNIETIIQIIIFVLVCFMVFFIWYATNVFLEKRKKEVGIYAFMGLSNKKIAKLYMIEIALTGLIALILGMFFGILSAQLFQMILLKLSDIVIEIIFGISFDSMLITALIYVIIYAIFVLKGYLTITRSSVLEMVSATRRNEYVKQKQWILYTKLVVGIFIICTGYYLAIEKGGMEVMVNAMAAVFLVCTGIYLLFGGLIPVLFQSLAKRKRFLYKKERTLWMNNIIFRIKKNYRTYAIVTIMLLCSITALGSGFAMKNRYDNIIHFRDTYTYQIVSSQPNLFDEYSQIVEHNNEITYSSQASILFISSQMLTSRYASSNYSILSYSNIQQLAKSTNLEFNIEEPADDEYVDINKLFLLSIITDSSNETIRINEKEYRNIGQTNIPYLGYLQEQSEFYLVNDAAYAKILSLGQEMHIYNYKLANLEHFEETTIALQEHPGTQGLVKLDGANNEIEWIKMLFSVCVFMFMVFVLASASILFMKLYNDAFEERERYAVLKKLGVPKKTLQKSIAYELRITYLTTFIVMGISSYFSLRAIGNIMHTDLFLINIVSVVIIAILLILCYFLSVSVYIKNVKVK